MKLKVEIIKKSDNPLFKRSEIEFKVDHAGAPTPKRLDVRAQLAALLGSPEELLVIDKFASTHGLQVARGTARVYSAREHLEAIEPKYLLKRGMPKEAKEKKPAETEKPAAEKPKELKK